MSESMPAWVHQGTRPATDSAYLSNLTRCVFQAGLNWTLVANKWPNFESAFNGFDVDRIAAYGAEDINRLNNDAGIIRNKRKILATIHNAREIQRISGEHGSFQAWLDALPKANNYDQVVKRLISTLKHVGPGTAHIFLWSVGEPIKYDESVHSRRPTKIA